MIKRILKIVGALLGILILGLLIWAWVINEPLPQGKSGTEADALATKMLTALNYESYKQTRYLEWSFRNNTHHYKWDKLKGVVAIKWSDVDVKLILASIEKSIVYEAGKIVEGERKLSLAEKAMDKFNNDSFWLVAPFKVFDNGTTRGIVKLKDGSKELLVTYAKGGSTPGDSYLWKLNPKGFPYAYQMWVGIIPIGGIEATWDDWMVTESGFYLPKSHQFGPLNLALDNVKAYN